MPLIGDVAPDSVYRAVGVALSCWEGIEVAFADLYSILRRRPFELATIQSFGDESATFVKRLGRLEQAADRYFARYCNQEDEGALHALCAGARNLARERHQIAHGMVQRIQFVEETADRSQFLATGMFWVCLPPWYVRGRFAEIAAEGLSSLAILDVSDRFNDFERQVRAYTKSFWQRSSPETSH